MILSTCNRVEFYGVACDPVAARRTLWNIFAKRQQREGELSDANLYYYSDRQAAEHLFRVTAGLDSMVLGEPQITGQVKEAFSFALKLGMTEFHLNQLLQRAFYISKRIRTETDIQRQPVSVPYAAVVLAEQIFGKLRGKTVCLVGAGQMSELAAKHLQEREIAQLFVTNRHRDKAQELARRYGGVTLAFEDLETSLQEADIVLTSTAAPGFVITAEAVREAMKRRKNQPMFFIDIGVPRDVDPVVNELMNVYLFDVDDLQQVVDGNLGEREGAAREAQSIIEREIARLEEEWRSRGVSQTIQQLTQHNFPRLLHRTIQWLKEPVEPVERKRREEMVREIFGLDEEESKTPSLKVVETDSKTSNS